MLVFLALFSGLVATIWRTARLFLPGTAAVGIGVALSLLLQLNTEALDLAVVELVPRDGGRDKELPA